MDVEPAATPPPGPVPPSVPVALLHRPAALHVIRLRGAWSCGAPTVDLDRVTAESQVEPVFSATVASQTRPQLGWSRGFGQPTGLTREERVALVIASTEAMARVVVNGVCLAERPPPRELAFDITSLLANRNLMRLDVVARVDRDAAFGDGPCGGGPFRDGSGGGQAISEFPGDVRLEIFRERL